MQCRFCQQPIYITESSLDVNGLTTYLRGKYRHIKDDAMYCVKELIPLTAPKPQCHICKTETSEHEMFCSASGLPPARARRAIR